MRLRLILKEEVMEKSESAMCDSERARSVLVHVRDLRKPNKEWLRQPNLKFQSVQWTFLNVQPLL